MLAGAAGLLAYSLLSSHLIKTYRWDSLIAAGVSGIAWFGVAFGLWGAFLR